MFIITSFYASLLALMLVGMSIFVIVQRIKAKVALGDGGDEVLLQRCRAQANFAEYTPMFLILLALLEAQEFSASGLYIIGAVFLVTRVMHALSLYKIAPFVFRQIGMAGTFTTLIVGSLILIWNFISL